MRGVSVALRQDNRVVRLDDRETTWRVDELTKRLLAVRRLLGIRVPATTRKSATTITTAATPTATRSPSLRPAARAALESFVGQITEIPVQRPRADNRVRSILGPHGRDGHDPCTERGGHSGTKSAVGNDRT